MKIAVASGKGGTGKTTVAVNLALSLDNAQLLDCDVEEPNAHIFLKPHIHTSKPVSVLVPEVDESLCNQCGRCQEVCAYNAIAVMPSSQKTPPPRKKVLIFNELCHSCGACEFFCLRGAIREIPRQIGCVEIGSKDGLAFAHGKLTVGEAMSPPLIKAVKECVDPTKNVILDAPPGTSCPVITALKMSDFCVLVTEPTPFGLNDLMLAVEVLRKMAIPFGVIINRADLGNAKTDEYCAQEKIPVLMRIPFKKEIAVAYSKGEPIVKAFPEYRKAFEELFNKIKEGKMQ